MQNVVQALVLSFGKVAWISNQMEQSYSHFTNFVAQLLPKCRLIVTVAHNVVVDECTLKVDSSATTFRRHLGDDDNLTTFRQHLDDSDN